MSFNKPERLQKNEWCVMPIPSHGEAKQLITKWHYSKGVANTSTYRHGLYRKSDGVLTGEAWGVALWIPPTKNAALSVSDNWQGVLALSRLCVSPDAPPNAASFLIGGSMKLIDRQRWPVLLTYADTFHGHTGAIYKATNWIELGPVAAGDTWVDQTGRQMGRKRGGRTLTAQEMREQGFTRLPLMPKIKFVHRIKGKS